MKTEEEKEFDRVMASWDKEEKRRRKRPRNAIGGLGKKFNATIKRNNFYTGKVDRVKVEGCE